MTDEKDVHDYYPERASGTPRWLIFAVVVLAGVSLFAVGAGYRAVAQAKSSALASRTTSEEIAALRQSIEILNNRVKTSEEINAQMQGELGVVTNKLKLTQGELSRARKQGVEIRQQYEQQIAAMENVVKSELAAKASADDVRALSENVNGVRSDLDSTKQNLQMARGELGTLIARNHEEIEQLRRLGQRDYFEFTLARKGTREQLGNLVSVELRGTNTKRNQFTVALYVDDMRLEKKNRAVNEPIYFYTSGTRAPLELVVNKISKDRITGYLSVPKSAGTPVASSGK
jgi:predicted  nucleic acid-binding Zn-ribbon protein